ncbi:hypothetical protein C8Q80DRAFT_819591 [Daedaleopsis nitida]|nr:hypothetical protein C8Q80DRAFT_819591 [Daedaleopsis nitida]
MSTSPTTSPKTPRASQRLFAAHDPDITPTRSRIHTQIGTHFPPIDAPFGGVSRRNSWEDLLDPVSALADPRELCHLDFSHDQSVEHSRDALSEFMRALWVEFRARAEDFFAMRRVLQRRNADGHADYEAIIDRASMLFAGHPDLALSLNHLLPPGYSLEAGDSYVTVTTPMCVWRRYPDGRRQYLDMRTDTSAF